MKTFRITEQESGILLECGVSLYLPAAAVLNGEKLAMTLSERTADGSVYRGPCCELRFGYRADCVTVSFRRDFETETPIHACRLFDGGVRLDGFDRAFTTQPRNNEGLNMDYWAHLPDVSANGYFSPPLLNLCIGCPDGWVGIGWLDLPDSMQLRMEADRSILAESCGGSKTATHYRAPTLLFTFPRDEWDAVTVFREKLIEFGCYTPSLSPVSGKPRWWMDPFICTYGDQLLQDRVGLGIDQAWVETFIQTAETDWGIRRMNLVIDAFWQTPHNFGPSVDTARFPDLRALADRLHERGHHLILWAPPMFDKTTNGIVSPAMESGVLSDHLLTGPYFDRYPGCRSIDYTSDAARPFLRRVCEGLFGKGKGQLDADGVKLDFMGLLRDPAETRSYAHAERGIGIRELYAFFSMFSEEARRVKPEVVIDCTTGDPRFESFMTHNRLHDTHAGVQEKELRARLATLACPDLLAESDGALMYTEWLRRHYLSAAVYGVPACYYLRGFHDYGAFQGYRPYTPEEAAHKDLLPEEKLAFGRLFQLTRYKPDGVPVTDGEGNWKLVAADGRVTALCIRGETVLYYPTEPGGKGYLFSFLNEAQILPLCGHRISCMTPAPYRDHLLTDYARDRMIVHTRSGVLYTFREADDGTSLDAAFRRSTLKTAEQIMNYVN